MTNRKPVPTHPKLQTTRAITLAVRQIKGSKIDAFAHDVATAFDALKGVLPDDLQIELTHNEPEEVNRKVEQFDEKRHRSHRHRRLGRVGLHGMAQRAARGRLHPADRRHDARHSAN